MSGLTRYRFTVLNYAPTVIAESIAPCFGLAKNISQPEHSFIRLFVSNQWDRDISQHTREYIGAFIEHVLSLSMIDLDRLLLGMQDTSVGQLRLGLTGACNEDELTSVVEEVLGGSGYTEPTVSNL